MPNCTIYKNGVNAALKAGVYKPANYAACRLKQVTGAAHSSGYGHGGRRTRKASRKSHRKSRRMHGGEANTRICVESLEAALPSAADYTRLQNQASSSVNVTQDYDAWVRGQINKARSLPPDECTFLTGLCSHVNNIKVMDMESGVPLGVTNVFFDRAGKLIITNPPL
jgi:hypothetical protein